MGLLGLSLITYFSPLTTSLLHVCIFYGFIFRMKEDGDMIPVVVRILSVVYKCLWLFSWLA